MAQETLEPPATPARGGAPRFAPDRDRLLTWGGALVAFAIGVALFSRFGIDGNLWRDESIYAYGGQQLTDGVAPYASIFDPKTPLGTMLAAAGVVVANVFGGDQIYAMRVEFFLFACLTVVAVYLLATALWSSRLAGLVSAAVFASFRGFAFDALAGPDAKTPGIFFGVLSMWLLVRRQWFWGAFVGSLAFLVWQPLLVYPGAAVLFAVAASDKGDRRKSGARALGGAALPVAATGLYFLAAGALGKLAQATFFFPLNGVERGAAVDTPFDHITRVLSGMYRDMRIPFWAGLILMVAIVAAGFVRRGRSNLRGALLDPYLMVVLTTFLGIAAFSLTDFQGFPDLFPLLPYAALGLGGAAAFAVKLLPAERMRRAATAVGLVLVAALVGLTWSLYSDTPGRGLPLPVERANAATLDRILGSDGTLYALGDPTPLVLTKRTNPDRYIYLRSGVDKWVIRHTRGGLAGWEAQIRDSDAEVVIMGAWGTGVAHKVRRYLTTVYGEPGHLGTWTVFVKPALRQRAAREGVTF